MSSDGRAALLWQSAAFFSGGWAIEGKTFSRSGSFESELLPIKTKEDPLFAPVLTFRSDSGLLAIWSRSHDSPRDEPFADSFGRSLDSLGRARAKPFRLTGPSNREVARIIGGVALTDDDGWIAVWTQIRRDTNPARNTVMARRYAGHGEPVGEPYKLPRSESDNASGPRIARDPISGRFLVVWSASQLDGSKEGVFGRILGPDGGLASPVFQINTYTDDDQQTFGVASDGLGHFFVVWRSAFQDGAGYGVYAQRLDSEGRRVGDEFRVNDNTVEAEDHPSVSSDGRGNVAVAWDTTFDTYLKLYRADGTAVAKTFRVTNDPFKDHDTPSVAFSPAGLLVVAWVQHEGFSGIDPNIYLQRFSASPGAEACVFRRGRFLCDVGRSGGAPEIDLPFGQAGDIPLLGDVDGDLRADTCVRRGRAFFCDLDHDFEADFQIGMGLAGDTPLLGDIDGDGRADPCLYRSGRFLCDTAHDGRRPEVTITFGGRSGDIPLLGDLNQDGKADPCVYRENTFLCDLGHDGGEPDLLLAFAPIAGRPLLVDVDGDGEVDPCLWGAGTFRCSIAGDSSFTLRFGGEEPGDIPLFANLDGL